MSYLAMSELLDAGVHFGHQTRRWNPKMKPYIHGARNGIYIIDLHQTIELFDQAAKFLQEIVQKNGKIMFVGTKKQAQEPTRIAAKRSGSFYVNERWLGGMLTNFPTIRDRIGRLKELDRWFMDGTLEKFPKNEQLRLAEQRAKLERFLGGIKEMHDVPDVLFIVDLRKERIAVAEARRLGIPIVALVDTNCNPDDADIVVPANDDAIRSIELLMSRVADVLVEISGEQYSPSESRDQDIEQALVDAPDAEGDDDEDEVPPADDEE